MSQMAQPLASPTAISYTSTNDDTTSQSQQKPGDHPTAINHADDGLYHPNHVTDSLSNTQAILELPAASKVTQDEQTKDAPRTLDDGFYHPPQVVGAIHTKAPDDGMYHPAQAANPWDTSAPTRINIDPNQSRQTLSHTQATSMLNTLMTTTLATQTMQSLSSSMSSTQRTASSTDSQAPSSQSVASAKLNGVYAAISVLIAVALILGAAVASIRRKKRLLKARLNKPENPFSDEHGISSTQIPLLYLQNAKGTAATMFSRLRSIHSAVYKHRETRANVDGMADEKASPREKFFRLSLKLDGKHSHLKELKDEFLESITTLSSERTMVEPETTSKCQDKACKGSEQFSLVKYSDTTKVPDPKHGLFQVEMDFRPLKPGQVKLHRGNLATIYEVFDNGWVFCVLKGSSHQGLAPRACFSGEPMSDDSEPDLSQHVSPPPVLVADAVQPYGRFYPRIHPARLTRPPSESNIVPRHESSPRQIFWQRFR